MRGRVEGGGWVNMLNSGNVVNKIQKVLDISVHCGEVSVPNRHNGGVRLAGDVPTDFIDRICSGLAEHQDITVNNGLVVATTQLSQTEHLHSSCPSPLRGLLFGIQTPYYFRNVLESINITLGSEMERAFKQCFVRLL